MKPFQVAQALCHIASKIQQSKQPDRKLVARDLKRVLAALDGTQGTWPVVLTTYEGWEHDYKNPPQMMESVDWMQYLQQSESNAVVINRNGHPIVITVGAGGGSMYFAEITQDALDAGMRPQDFEGPFALDGGGLGELVAQAF